MKTIPLEIRDLIGHDASTIYCAVIAILADRNARSSVVTHERLMRTARCGITVIEAAQTILHTRGMLDIELADWNLVNPKQSRFRYTLPEGMTIH